MLSTSNVSGQSVPHSYANPSPKSSAMVAGGAQPRERALLPHAIETSVEGENTDL